MLFWLLVVIVGAYAWKDRVRLLTLWKIYRSLSGVVETAPRFEVHSSERMAIIPYERTATNYKLCVPFRRRMAVSMLDLKAELIFADGSRVDITQQPGIPYGYAAADLGGVEIEITNAATGEMQTYRMSAPMYADELHE